MKVITILFIFIKFCEILSLKIPPDNFKELDNPYRNDIEITTEKDHHIITAVSPKGYVDYYKGIYYIIHFLNFSFYIFRSLFIKI